MNGGIINSVTRFHLIGCFNWIILQCTDPLILNACLYVKCPTFFLILTEFVVSEMSIKVPNIKLHENFSSRSRTVACGRTDWGTNGMTKQIDASREYAQAPKNIGIWWPVLSQTLDSQEFPVVLIIWKYENYITGVDSNSLKFIGCFMEISHLLPKIERGTYRNAEKNPGSHKLLFFVQ
jgi:hypothetical protein